MVLIEKAIEHDVDKYLNNMISINSSILSSWSKNYAIVTHKIDGDMIPNISGYEDIYPLDILYQISKSGQ